MSEDFWTKYSNRKEVWKEVKSRFSDFDDMCDCIDGNEGAHHSMCSTMLFRRLEDCEGDDSKFISHIQSHLKQGEEVICTICKKSADAICKDKKEGLQESEIAHDGIPPSNKLLGILPTIL